MRNLYVSNMLSLTLTEKPPTTLRYFEMEGFKLDDVILERELVGAPSNVGPGLEMVVKAAGHECKVYRAKQSGILEDKAGNLMPRTD